ncbi:MAG: bifunctional phosphoribosylaminoimidazolecarboxamide formyltransferase/IMP cyclohydrolase, partial [Myxococcota bacterium]|nr:bifunctional phosphoribosylaminoimidazolecarboxamide formyltransferase/IMP cyclohydrolase [Myxococcota bacterium]
MSTRYALLSVSDKTGITDLGRGLVGAGFTLLSTGGTARALESAGLPVVHVGDHTGHPEIMQGRVKTLHPRIHGGILGLRDAHAAEAAALDIPFIDIVACNLYPFEQTVLRDGIARQEAVEQIDIGGPSMIRSAAKNHESVTVLVDPEDYASVIAALGAGEPIDPSARRRFALKAFRHTAAYDSIISCWLARQEDDAGLVEEGAQALRLHETLRYGENPHQTAGFYADPLPVGRSLARAEQLQGKKLSFNNLADLDGALRAVFELDEPGCVVVTHMNP